MKITTKDVSRFADRFLWAVILVPILGISGWSLWWVARYLGSPQPVAIALSTCFDGVAIIAAKYAIRYAQADMTGSFPRLVVRVFALVGAYLQTLHARLGHEPFGAQIIWGSLPIAAAVVYDIHLRWERRQAMAKALSAYPRPLPSFGLTAWVLFPKSTYKVLRAVVHGRVIKLEAQATITLNAAKNEALEEAPAKSKQVIKAKAETVEPKAKTQRDIEVDLDVQRERERQDEQADIRKSNDARSDDPLRMRRAKTVKMRTWAKANGWPELGDFGRVPKDIEQAYDRANGGGS